MGKQNNARIYGCLCSAEKLRPLGYCFCFLSSFIITIMPFEFDYDFRYKSEDEYLDSLMEHQCEDWIGVRETLDPDTEKLLKKF